MIIRYTILITAIICLPSFAAIINIPDDYPTIQEGIDVSVDGDTVLVQPGLYVENVNFNGHNIVLGSLFLTTGDTAYISETIIDGDSSGSVVTFESGEDSTAVICGFTIQHGFSQFPSGGGGIACISSNPSIRNNAIIKNSSDEWGGGIFCYDSNPIIIYNAIRENTCTKGAGICCIANSNPTIKNNTISRNRGFDGAGGIYCHESSPLIINTILWANTVSEIHLTDTSFPIIRYCDIRGGWDGVGNINANPLFIEPYEGNYNICAQSDCIDAGDPETLDPDGTRADIGIFYLEHPECDFGNTRHVATTGDDANGDGSYDNPFRTIQHTIFASSYLDTIIVQNGTYFENINFDGRDIVVGSLFLTTGDMSYISSTVIDGNSSGSVVTFENAEDNSAVIIGFTIQNGVSFFGAGIQCWWNSNPSICYNIIRNNWAAWLGGGIHSGSSSPLIYNNAIFDNTVVGDGGGVVCIGLTSPIILNNTISQNIATSRGGGFYCETSFPIIVNSILWGNSSAEIYAYNSILTVSYSNIQGGWEGEGNIDTDPLFRDPESDDFHLMFTECGDPFDSPCIDAGHPDILDSLLDCSWGLGTILSDMGAYGGGDSVTVGIDFPDIPSPEKFSISQNYPNPFNAMTVIRYSLPEPSNVIIAIYDILGRKIEMLANEEQPAGYHQAIWDTTERSTGIYFYRIQAADYTDTRKMVLLR